MHFEPTSMQTEIRALTRKFADNELRPIVSEDEKAERFRPELIQKLGELGLTGIPTSEEFEGAGCGFMEYTAALEEIAAAHCSYAISVAVTGLPQLILSKFGNDAQKKKYIPKLAQGKATGSFCLSEPASGSDAGALQTTAKRDGDHFVLNGTKLWVTQGDQSEIFVVMARTGEPGPKGISAFILTNQMEGFRPGKREEKMGLSSSHTMEMVLDHVRVPVENLIGQEGIGFKIALTALDSGRITIGACAVGVAQEALNAAIRHAKEREQFGKPIGSFQGVSFLLADMKTQIEAARLLVSRAAWLRDQEKEFTIEAAMAKCFSTDIAMKVTIDAVQVLGGSGYTKEFPVERLMREAKVLQIVEGTNQIQRLVIGRSLIKDGSWQ